MKNNARSLVLFAVLLAAASAAPFLSTYWEAWNMRFPTDYAAYMPNATYGKIGSGKGYNTVNVAFGDYTFGSDENGEITIGYVNSMYNHKGELYTPAKLREDVDALHGHGAQVKISFGGATFSMASHISSEAQAKEFAKKVRDLMDQNNLDGVDFDCEAGTPSNIQIAVLKHCHEMIGENRVISYTIPGEALHMEPYHTVVEQGHPYINSLNIMCYDVYWTGYDPKKDFERAMALGVPKEKIVWGVMPGQHDASTEYTKLEDAIEFAEYVRDTGMAGVMVWDVNRDTDHRTASSGPLY